VPEDRTHVGIKAIADAAGVSITTVSHALNGKGRLLPETRERVREIAERLNYRPNQTARNLVEGRTGLLGLSLSQADGPVLKASDFAYFTQLMSGASMAAIDRGYALVLTPPSWGLGARAGAAIDGAIIVDPIRGDPLAGQLHRSGVPVVTTGRVLDDDALDCWVDNDHPAGARALLEHLRRRGAARIALINTDTPMSYTVDVDQTFRSWCETHGIEPLIIHAHDFTEGAGFAAAQDLLSRPTPPDAIYATYDRLAYGTLLAAQARGVRVPDELLLVSTATESEATSRLHPSLTVLNLYPDLIGHRAAQLLGDLVEGREPPERQITVPTRVVTRASTRRPRRSGKTATQAAD
jgi:DNA-binding LacI/PurR family transcriptional regulator